MSWLDEQDGITEIDLASQIGVIGSDSNQSQKSPSDAPLYGYPKIVKLQSNANQGPLVPASNTAVLMQTVVFNYGGYTFVNTGGVQYGVIVPEPGIYHVSAQVTMTGGGGVGFNLDFSVNGGLPAPTDSTTVADSTANPRGNFSAYQSLNAGDSVGVVVTSASAYNLLGTYCKLTVCKQEYRG